MQWRSRGRSVASCLTAVVGLAAVGCFAACARGGVPPEPPSCSDEISTPVNDCVTERFVDEGTTGWRLDIQAVIDTCVQLRASISCDTDAVTCAPDASTLVTPESWPEICDAQTRERFDPETTVDDVDVPPSIVSAVEAARTVCPAGTCRLATDAFVLDFGERPSVLELDSAVEVASTRVQAAQTWELHIGVIQDRSLSPAAIETALEPFGAEGMAVVQALIAQSGQQVQFARYERVVQERRERVVQQVIITLASQGETSLLVLLEVDLTQT